MMEAKNIMNAVVSVGSGRIAEAAEKNGMSAEDFIEMAVRWMLVMADAAPEIIRAECKPLLEDQRKGTESDGVVPPSFDLIFTSELDVEESPGTPRPEYYFLKDALESFLEDKDLDTIEGKLYVLSEAIKHHPGLKNEVRAMNAFCAADGLFKAIMYNRHL